MKEHRPRLFRLVKKEPVRFKLRKPVVVDIDDKLKDIYLREN